MSGGGKTVCKGRMGSSIVSDVDTQDLARNESRLKQVYLNCHAFSYKLLHAVDFEEIVSLKLISALFLI